MAPNTYLNDWLFSFINILSIFIYKFFNETFFKIYLNYINIYILKKEWKNIGYDACAESSIGNLGTNDLGYWLHLRVIFHASILKKKR